MRNINPRLILIFKLVPFIVLFSIAFAIFRFSGWELFPMLSANLNGISWLYSTVGLIFGIISAFIIQTEWENWNNLTNAVREEIRAIRQLLMFSSHLPLKLAQSTRDSMKNYVNLLINDGWKKIEQGERLDDLEQAIVAIQENVYLIADQVPQMSNVAFTIFSQVLSGRERRLQHSGRHLPLILHVFILLATFLIMLFSLFIAVDSIVLDYMFTLGIGILAYLIAILIEDLDNPLQPGSWQITTKEYRRLLYEIEEAMARPVPIARKK
ncbi:DUF4239 domain-containing protein [Candidatus Roizmanbacteria bacterium]|nr:DUF4239 domain-containing protein [Candidatus Roizmanbacteria bacterium]